MSKTEAEIVCQACRQFFPCSVLSGLSSLYPSPLDKSYSFTCAHCNGKLSFFHTEKSWLDLAATILFNLSLKNQKRFFSNKEIREFLKEYPELHAPSKESLRPLFLEFEAHQDLFESQRGKWSLRTVDSLVSSESSEEDMPIECEHKERHPARSGEQHNKQKKQKSLFQWCHQCKQKHEQVLHCSRECNKKYCAKCLQRHYNESEADIDRNNWVCVYCRQICSCAFCRKKKAKVTNTKFESRRGKKRSLSSSWRNSRKRQKMSTDKDENDSSSVVSEDECSVDKSIDQEFYIDQEDSDENSDMKLEIRETPPTSPSPSISPHRVADLYRWLKNDFLNAQDLIHGGPPTFEEHFPHEPTQTESMENQISFCEEDSFKFNTDGLSQESHSHFSQEIEMKKEDFLSKPITTVANKMWADSLLW